MKKKTSRLIAVLLLAPALALGAVSAEAQKKPTTPISRTSLYKAIEQDRPREALYQARVLKAQAQDTKDLPLLLETEKTIWEQLERLDPTQPSTSYKSLHELSQLPWLKPSDRAALQLFMLEHYLIPYYYSRHENRPVRKIYDPVDPSEWREEQFLAFYTAHVDQLLSDLPLLTQSLSPYSRLFDQDSKEGPEGRTFASELLRQLTSSSAKILSGLRKKTLQTLQTLDPASLPPYTASFIDQQTTIDRLEQLDPSAKKTALPAELEGFLQRWGKDKVINHYISWLKNDSHARGLAKVRWLEHIKQVAKALSKQQLDELNSSIRYAREAQLTLQLPDLLVGRRTATLTIPQAYLVREVEVSLYAAPKNYNPTQTEWSITKGQLPLWTKRITLSLDSLGQLAKEEQVEISVPEAGAYLVKSNYLLDKEANGTRDSQTDYLNATDYIALKKMTSRQNSVQWLEALTGKPLSGASFESYKRENWHQPAQKVGLVKADAWGRFPVGQATLFHLADSRDPLLAEVPQSIDIDKGFKLFEVSEQEPQRIQGFVTPDRPAYRPGQTARFYGILSRIFPQAEKAVVVPDTPLSVMIYDASGQIVRTQSVTTDRFGRFSASYQLPINCLTGSHSVEVSLMDKKVNFSSDFQVFEYKRMDALLTLDTPQLPLQAGNKVTITGSLRTLSGSPIPGAKVNYTLQTNRLFFHLFEEYSLGQPSQNLVGEDPITTDSEGRFSIPITLPELPTQEEELFEGRRISFPWHTYTLEVTATDATGEIHSESLHLPAGKNVGRIAPSLDTFIDKHAEKTLLSFGTFTIEKFACDVNYSIEQEGRKLFSSTTSTTGANVDLAPHLQSLAPGRYELHYRTSFSDSLEYAGSQAFYLFDSKKIGKLKDLRAPLLLSPGSGHYSATESPVIYWASSLPKAYIFYEIYTAQGMLMEGLLRSEPGRVQALPIDLSKRTELPEEINVRFWTVQDGHFIEEKTDLTRTQPKKTLTLQWHSFRNRLIAGSKETCRLTLHTPDGKPATETAVAAWMYDSALDAFGKLTPWEPSLRLDQTYGYGYYSYLRNDEDGLQPASAWFDRWEAEQRHGDFRGSAFPSDLQARWKAKQAVSVAEYDTSLSPVIEITDASTMSLSEGQALRALRSNGAKRAKIETALFGSRSVNQSAQEPPRLRTNFAENAFFFPSLTTDEQGSVSWSFEVPERLSRWRMMILAHTASLDHLTEVQMIETYRPFSVRPALPRFLNEGDTIHLVTEVRNESEKPQQGKLTLEIFNPNTEDVLHTETTSFDVSKGKTQAYTLPLKVYGGLDSIGLRILARSNEASDGEQHILAVRPARQPITERLTFTRHLQGVDSVSLKSILPKGVALDLDEEGTLSIQANSHAAFSAFSALQGLSTSKDASAFAIATSLYAQILVQALKEQSSLIDWARERLRNDPLRTARLLQTPWLGITTKEQEAELNLALELISDRSALESDRLLGQLEKQQGTDGLWAWYPGMSGNLYTTETVLRLLLRLPSERLESAHRLRLDRLIRKGLQALEQETIRLHQRIVSKKEPIATPGDLGLSYLALSKDAQQRGIFSPSHAGEKAEAYFLSRLRREVHRLPLWLKPSAGRVFLNSGDVKLAQALATSLREHLIADETGYFFASLGASPYSWIDKSMSTIVETLQLFRQLKLKDSVAIDGMIRWIINQKRTTTWSNELASADAIHALLLGDPSQSYYHNDHLGIEVPLKGNVSLNSWGSAITTSIPIARLRSTDPQIILQQDSLGVVWGAAIASYTLPTSSVQTASGKELRLQREVFVVHKQGDKEELLPLREGHELRVGDRIRTRITIQLDRAMDFLRLSDPRSGYTEPANQIPSYAWGEGTGYYLEPKDQQTNFYIDHLARGSYLVWYDELVARSGTFHGGVTELVSCYAPEFGAHTAVAPTQIVLPLQGT